MCCREWQTPGPINRTPETPGSGKNEKICTGLLKRFLQFKDDISGREIFWPHCTSFNTLMGGKNVIQKTHCIMLGFKDALFLCGRRRPFEMEPCKIWSWRLWAGATLWCDGRQWMAGCSPPGLLGLGLAGWAQKTSFTSNMLTRAQPWLYQGNTIDWLERRRLFVIRSSLQC